MQMLYLCDGGGGVKQALYRQSSLIEVCQGRLDQSARDSPLLPRMHCN